MPSNQILSQADEAASSLARRRNSASAIANSEMPQSKQTTTSVNTHTTGLSMFFSPGEWIPISAVNLRRRNDPHDLHLMYPPNRTLRSSRIDQAGDLSNRANKVAKIDLMRYGAAPRTRSGSKDLPVASRHVLSDSLSFLSGSDPWKSIPWNAGIPYGSGRAELREDRL